MAKRTIERLTISLWMSSCTANFLDAAVCIDSNFLSCVFFFTVSCFILLQRWNPQATLETRNVLPTCVLRALCNVIVAIDIAANCSLVSACFSFSLYIFLHAFQFIFLFLLLRSSRSFLFCCWLLYFSCFIPRSYFYENK